ncbi:RNA polymerase II transcription factor SIII subunit A3 [Mortierella sp. AD031]|nr:RNA polymerase II transcription factor SIII subunit A3 [Mortierella sp. AD031]
MAFTGVGQRLGSGQEGALPLWETPPTTPTTTRAVPSLKDLCLSTLDRYIDLLDDIGTTPYFLIESVLRKCNVKQLTRVELHTEGLSEETDELWFLHALNDFESLRKQKPEYDRSGEWRSKYQAMKREEEEKYERITARLRQKYSQHDKAKQDRRVIIDPTLRLPSKPVRQPGSSSWSTAAPKKKSLFEKARMEARKITQMYNSNPYPPPRSRITTSTSSSIQVFDKAPDTSSPQHRSSPTIQLQLRWVHPTIGKIAPHWDKAPSNPVVYLAPSKISSVPQTNTHHGGGNSSSTGSSMSPTSPIRPATPAKPAASSPNGAIMDFFKQINPAHSQQATSSLHGLNQGGPRSPTSPVAPASKTMEMLREPVTTTTTTSRGERSGNSSSRKQDRTQARGSSDTMKQVKIDGDFSWLEDDNDDNDDDMDVDHEHGKTRHQSQHKRNQSGGYFQEGSPPAKKHPDQAHSSLDEASRHLF